MRRVQGAGALVLFVCIGVMRLPTALAAVAPSLSFENNIDPSTSTIAVSTEVVSNNWLPGSVVDFVVSNPQAVLQSEQHDANSYGRWTTYIYAPTYESVWDACATGYDTDGVPVRVCRTLTIKVMTDPTFPSATTTAPKATSTTTSTATSTTLRITTTTARSAVPTTTAGGRLDPLPASATTSDSTVSATSVAESGTLLPAAEIASSEASGGSEAGVAPGAWVLVVVGAVTAIGGVLLGLGIARVLRGAPLR